MFEFATVMMSCSVVDRLATFGSGESVRRVLEPNERRLAVAVVPPVMTWSATSMVLVNFSDSEPPAGIGFAVATVASVDLGSEFGVGVAAGGRVWGFWEYGRLLQRGVWISGVEENYYRVIEWVAPDWLYREIDRLGGRQGGALKGVG